MENATKQDTTSPNTLLILGIASFLLYPLTAIPGIIIAKRKGTLSYGERIGYRLCWAAMALFGVHLILVASLLYWGLSRAH